MFANDGLGTFSLTTTGSTGGDNSLFNIDPKTGKITSKAALDAGAATDTNGNGSTAGNGVYDIQVTYTPRNGVPRMSK